MLSSKTLCAIAVMLSSASAYSTEDISLYEDEASDPRLFFANYTSGKKWWSCIDSVIHSIMVINQLYEYITEC